MHRLQITEFDEKGAPERKEYLTYDEQLFVKDWLGNEIHVSYIEAVYDAPKLITTTELDVNTENYIEKTSPSECKRNSISHFQRKQP